MDALRVGVLGVLLGISGASGGVFGFGGAKFVPGAAEGLEGKRGAELGPQAAHVDVYRAGAAFVAIAPDAREEMLAREHLAAPLAEVGEEGKFFRGELDRKSVV